MCPPAGDSFAVNAVSLVPLEERELTRPKGALFAALAILCEACIAYGRAPDSHRVSFCPPRDPSAGDVFNGISPKDERLHGIPQGICKPVSQLFLTLPCMSCTLPDHVNASPGRQSGLPECFLDVSSMPRVALGRGFRASLDTVALAGWWYRSPSDLA